jgi:HSF-type DNA-binding
MTFLRSDDAKSSAELTYPLFSEQLMIMLTHVEKVYAKGGKRIDSSPVEWVQDGMVVYIRDKNKLAKDWLPQFFQQTKFSR